MPRVAASVAVLLAALVPVAGCGGAEVAYTEVKSAPQALPIPQDTGTGTADPTADDKTTSGSEDGVKKTKAGDDTGAASSGGTAASGTTGSGATTPSTTSQSAATATPAPAATVAPSTGTGANTGGSTPPTPSTGTSSGGSSTGGASPGADDQFCADNPGACNGGN